ncbi:hypothetical protein [Phyllobacterium lublinensis]|nr:hypothetical protein [Phyllobacterium sp. 2063]
MATLPPNLLFLFHGQRLDAWIKRLGLVVALRGGNGCGRGAWPG